MVQESGLNRSVEKKEKDFKTLFDEFYVPFCLYAKRFVKNGEVARDICQDVFSRIWDKFDVIDPDSGSLIGYIKASVRNRCVDYLRRQENEYSYISNALNSTPVYADGPDQVYTLEELYKILLDTLDEMPEENREVFIGTFIEGKTREEVARKLDVSVKSVGRYKGKVLAILKERFKDYLPMLLILINNS